MLKFSLLPPGRKPESTRSLPAADVERIVHMYHILDSEQLSPDLAARFQNGVLDLISQSQMIARAMETVLYSLKARGDTDAAELFKQHAGEIRAAIIAALPSWLFSADTRRSILDYYKGDKLKSGRTPVGSVLQKLGSLLSNLVWATAREYIDTKHFTQSPSWGGTGAQSLTPGTEQGGSLAETLGTEDKAFTGATDTIAADYPEVREHIGGILQGVFSRLEGRSMDDAAIESAVREEVEDYVKFRKNLAQDSEEDFPDIHYWDQHEDEVIRGLSASLKKIRDSHEL